MKYIIKGTSSHPKKDTNPDVDDSYYSFDDEQEANIPIFHLITKTKNHPYSARAYDFDHYFYTWDVLTEEEYVLELI